MKRLALICLAVVTLGAGCAEVSFVERVVIVNNTIYEPHVQVRGSTGGWLLLTTVPPRSTREVREVIDQGDLWVFRFTYARYEPFDLEVSRQELAEAGWRVEVPQELEDALRDQDVAPPP